MTKMAAMPKYGKNLKKSSPEPSQLTLKVSMQHQQLEYYQVCSTDDPEVTMTHFTATSNLVPYAFAWEKGKTMDFSETFVNYDLKLATDDWSGKKLEDCWPQNFVPWGLHAHCRVAIIHVLNHEKIV